MIIDNDRSSFDESLTDANATVFILFGGDSAYAAQVHETISRQNWEVYETYYRVSNLAILTDTEKLRWGFDGNSERYAVLGGNSQPKTVAVKGPITDLLTAELDVLVPDELKINRAKAKGNSVGAE